MDWRKRFPELADLENEDIRRLLKRSTLSRMDKQIAINCLCWEMADVDSAAAVHVYRSTVGRRLRGKIVPQLTRLMYKEMNKRCAGA